MQAFHLLSNLDTNIAHFIAVHGSLIYVLLFGVVFLEIGVFPLFFLPGNPLIFITGSFCKLGALGIIPSVATLLSAAILGNLVSYYLGKKLGSTISSGQSRWINQEAITKTHDFYAKYGNLTLILSPFIAVVRTFAPLLAGIGKMPYKQYISASALGSLFWILGLVFAGYFFSGIAVIQHHMASIVLAGLAVGLGVLLLGFFNRRRR